MKRTTTTKDVALLQQLHQGAQLELAPEFQRLSVWPRPAKAYLIDSILKDRPIPLLFFSRSVDPQTGRPAYVVVDGQQRLRAVFEFLDGKFTVSSSAGKRVRFAKMGPDDRDSILNYEFSVVELSGYSDADIEDVFVRMNKYGVKLSPQELRHARTKGAFKKTVQEIGHWPFWTEQKVFSSQAVKRMRQDEFAAELLILLSEGPQDKKQAVDLYYLSYAKAFPEGSSLGESLRNYTSWMVRAIPELSTSRYRRPVEMYGVVGALEQLTNSRSLAKLNAREIGRRLQAFEELLKDPNPSGQAARYLVAASRQTDNLKPRQTRIDILQQVMSSGS